MSEYNVSVSGGVHDLNVPLHGHLGVEIRQYPVVPNPEGEATEEIYKMGIAGVVYEVKDAEARTVLNNKVDKEEGKGLSENDFTNTLKSKLDHIENGAEVNVQSDFGQTNSSADDFIKNKPTKLSDFDNDEGFIDNTVNNLVNYYKKAETYTQAEVNALIGSIVTISILVVQELPVTGENNIIYLVPVEDPNPNNIYEEYIYVNNSWEMIGTTAVDLSNYYTKAETDNLLLAKANSSDLSTVATSGSYNDLSNKPVIDTAISPTSTNAVQNKVIYDLLNDLLPEATATGNPIAISNASGFNVKALTVDMLPIQALHGYDKPWSGGSGKNKLPNGNSTSNNGITYTVNSDGTVTANGTATGTSTFTVSSPYLSSGSYMLSGCPSGGGSSSYEILMNTGSGTIYRDYGSGKDFTLSSDTTFLNWQIVVRNGVTVNNLVFKPMVESGSVATTYEPYSNICPISGRTSLDVTVNGETETLNLGQTVYGGTSDVVNGGTSDEWGYIASYNGETLSGEWLSDRDEYVSGTTPTIGAEVVYKKTPTTINTPATTIPLEKGNNTLSTSGDNMNLKYSTTISNPTPSLTMARPSLGMVVPTIDSTEDTRLLNNANIDVVEEPTEEVGEMER